jgi:hypothetical protein
VPPTADPATVPGLPESTLSAEHLAALPPDAPAAPWVCRTRAVFWLQRTRQRPQFDWLGSPVPVAMGGFVDYLDTPVGPYREVFAGNLLRDGVRPRAQIPFMAVDSVASVAGGRLNWALPKTMATFDVDLPNATGRAEGDGWSISIRPLRSGAAPSRLPLPFRTPLAAIGPLGTFVIRPRLHGRPVLVRTRVEGPTLTAWLGSGTHLAVVLDGEMRVDAPT